MGRGSKYHGYGVRCTMGRGVKIPWVGIDISLVGGQYTIGRRVKIPWIGRSRYHGNGVDIPWVGGQYIMDRRVIISGKCVNIPCEGDQNTIGKGCQNTMGKWELIPMVGCLIYHGEEGQNIMGRRADIPLLRGTT